MLPIVRSFYQHPRFKALLLRRTYPELESELIVRSQNFYPQCGGEYNAGKKKWTFKSGAIIQFGHAEYEKDVRNYDSAEYNYIGLDELTSFTQFQYLYLTSRCRTSVKELPAIIRSGTNPGNVGHSWVRDRFIEPFPAGQRILLDKISQLKRIFIPSKVSDNPHIDQGYSQRLSILPDAERRAKLDGDWWTFSGQVFDDWRENPLPDEPPNARHVIEPFPIPSWWPRFLAVDWGYSAMAVALWGAVSPDNRLFIYREHTAIREKISTWGTIVGKLSKGEDFRDIVICQSAVQDRGNELTVLGEFKQYSGLLARPSGNMAGSRIATKILVQEFIRWKQRPLKKDINEGFSQDEAQEVLRKLGTDAYHAYCQQFQPEPEEDNLPRLQIFQDCKTLIKTIPLCVYDNNNKEDVAEFPGDDPYDCLRYLVKAVHEFRRDLSEIGKYNDQIATVLKNFQMTNDQTYLHRQMSILESKKPRMNHPVPMFHRGKVRS